MGLPVSSGQERIGEAAGESYRPLRAPHAARHPSEARTGLGIVREWTKLGQEFLCFRKR